MNKFFIKVTAFAVIAVVAIVGVAMIEESPATFVPVPEEYYTSYDGDRQSVVISCPFSTGNNVWEVEDKVILPGLGAGKIWLGTEGAYFILDDGEIMPMIQQSDNISTLYFYEMRESVLVTWVVIFYENRDEWDVTWRARLEPKEKVVLPTGEEATFLGFDSHTGSPRFSVIAWS